MNTARTLTALGLALTLLGGCAGGGSRSATEAALMTARRADASAGERVTAIKAVKSEVAVGQTDRLVARDAMKELAWALDTPEVVRAAALEAILWDDQEAEDSRRLVREMLPTEPGRDCVAVLATAAADQGWTDATPALVRSLARPVPMVADRERSEYRALGVLYPGRDLAGLVAGVFLDPRTEPGAAGLRLDMRVREAAWDLVGRLVPDGDARIRLLESAPGGDEEGLAILAGLRELHADLGVVPARGEEVRWALSLLGERGGRLSAWWEQTRVAVAGMSPQVRAGLEMRHLEAVRWMGQHQPDRLTADRALLLEDLASRLAGRQVYGRTEAIEGTPNANAERLSANRDRLTWGDLLTLLVIDRAVGDPGVARVLFETAAVDHDDSSTEHGGTLWADAGGFHAQHFAPRGTASPDDRRFVAPREMIDYSSAALAHFHFHVANWRNREYAGPSPGDLDYADRFGRACVVLTGVSRGVLNADVYFPGGAVVDLGEVRATPGP